jgi:hypothetical protein
MRNVTRGNRCDNVTDFGVLPIVKGNLIEMIDLNLNAIPVILWNLIRELIMLETQRAIPARNGAPNAEHTKTATKRGRHFAFFLKLEMDMFTLL